MTNARVLQSSMWLHNQFILIPYLLYLEIYINYAYSEPKCPRCQKTCHYNHIHNFFTLRMKQQRSIKIYTYFLDASLLSPQLVIMPLRVELVKSGVVELPVSPVSLLLERQSFLHELPTTSKPLIYKSSYFSQEGALRKEPKKKQRGTSTWQKFPELEAGLFDLLKNQHSAAVSTFLFPLKQNALQKILI